MCGAGVDVFVFVCKKKKKEKKKFILYPFVYLSIYLFICEEVRGEGYVLNWLGLFYKRDECKKPASPLTPSHLLGA